MGLNAERRKNKIRIGNVHKSNSEEEEEPVKGLAEILHEVSH